MTSKTEIASTDNDPRDSDDIERDIQWHERDERNRILWKKRRKLTILVLLILPILGYIFFWKHYGSIHEVKILRGLKNNQSVVCYTGGTWAFNAAEINVSFFDQDFDSLEKGDIFWGYGGQVVDFVKISTDTVLIQAGFGSDIYHYADSARGIIFKYDFETDPKNRIDY